MLAKTDFGLGGVNVDVDFFGRHFKEQQNDGKAGGRNDVAIGLGDGVQQEAVADEALVDEDVDGIAVELLQFGLGVEAGEAQRTGLALRFVRIFFPRRRLGQAGALERSFGGDGKQLAERLLAEDLEDALGGASDGRRGEDGVAWRRAARIASQDGPGRSG